MQVLSMSLRDRAIQRAVDRAMAQAEGHLADQRRKFVTDTIADDVDPDQIDAALEMNDADLETFRAELRKQLTAWLDATNLAQ